MRCSASFFGRAFSCFLGWIAHGCDDVSRIRLLATRYSMLATLPAASPPHRIRRKNQPPKANMATFGAKAAVKGWITLRSPMALAAFNKRKYTRNSPMDFETPTAGFTRTPEKIGRAHV